jgi:hypothetical protein
MSTAEEIHEGGCLCGAVRYRAIGTPLRVNHCHCRMCLKATGAAVATWATFPRNRVSFTRGAPTIRRSSEIAVRGFCASCGSALLWQADTAPDTIDLTAGTLDDPGRVRPLEHLWTESAVGWLHIEDGLPRYPRSRSG